MDGNRLWNEDAHGLRKRPCYCYSHRWVSTALTQPGGLRPLEGALSLPHPHCCQIAQWLQSVRSQLKSLCSGCPADQKPSLTQRPLAILKRYTTRVLPWKSSIQTRGDMGARKSGLSARERVRKRSTIKVSFFPLGGHF